MQLKQNSKGVTLTAKYEVFIRLYHGNCHLVREIKL